MKKTIALLCVLAASAFAQSPTPTPTPTPVPVASADNLVLDVRAVPVTVIEALRGQVVASGAFGFPAGIADRPLKSVALFVVGDKVNGRIVLGPAASPTPAP